MDSAVKKFGALLIILMYSSGLIGQSISVEVSYDTVYMGNVLQLKYSMENWEGDLKSPDLGDFGLLSGPSMSSSISISGGQRSSRKSIRFFLKPPEEAGEYTIPAQEFYNGEEVLSSEEKTIIVLDNPDNIKQNPEIVSKRNNPFIHQPPSEQPPKRGERRKF